jgi:hypothetical protein
LGLVLGKFFQMKRISCILLLFIWFLRWLYWACRIDDWKICAKPVEFVVSGSGSTAVIWRKFGYFPAIIIFPQ